MKTTDVMTWARSLGLAPADIMGMMDFRDPDWPTAISAIYVEATETGPHGPGSEPERYILPVPPYFNAEFGAMARELLEEIEDGITWHVDIKKMVARDESVFGNPCQGFTYTTGTQKFWDLSSTISAIMGAEIAGSKQSCFITEDYSDMDRFNGDKPRGKMTRPHHYFIAEKAAHRMEQRHPGAVQSYRNHEGPWTLLALRAGYAALRKMEGKR